MNPSFLKKSGLVTSHLSRDFFVAKMGAKIPSVAEYAKRFSVSRGIVQNSLAFLEEKKAIEIRKDGARGTYLTAIHPEILQQYTGWDAITGTMPLPLNRQLASLATAINVEMQTLPVPASFAYISGSGKRLDNLLRHMYDFIVVSLSTAQKDLAGHPELEEPIILDNCTYSLVYLLYFTSPKYGHCTEIQDGMRVAIDSTATDQYILTKILCEGKQVEFVELPYIGFKEVVTAKAADCMVFRQEDWLKEFPWVHGQMIELPGFSLKEMVTPAILVHRENYGMRRILEKHLDKTAIREVQKQVLNGEREVRIY